MSRLGDVEAMVIAFLKPRVDGGVGTKAPSPLPAAFTRVWRSGGTALNRIYESAMVTVTVWGTSTVDASQRAIDARNAFLHESSAMPLVRGVEESGGLYYDPDPTTGADRYTFTMTLKVRAAR